MAAPRLCQQPASTRWLVAATFAGLAVAPAVARADETVDRCVDADTRAQSLRREGKLTAAREQLQICADARCPALVRDDCSQLLDDLDRARPTIVFDAKDEADRDLTEVRVQIDGRPFADRLDGMALPADPGEHTFTFEAPGRVVVTEHVVLREGEKGRRERVVLGAPEKARQGPSPQAAPPPEAAPPRRAPAEAIGTQRIFAITLGGIGLMTLGASATLAFLAKSKSDDANRACSMTSCPDPVDWSTNNDAIAFGNAATATLVVGASAVGAGFFLWITGHPSAGRASVALTLDPSPGGGTLRVGSTWR